MKKILLILMAFLFIPLIAAGVAYAGPNDGTHDFSLDNDTAPPVLNRPLANGDIYFSNEDGNFNSNSPNDPATPGNFDFNIPMATLGVPDPTAEVDALSGYHTGDHTHNVSLWDMYFGEYRMMYSVDGDSNIFEWKVDGPPPSTSPSPPARNITPSHVHDTAADLGLLSHDLDALESHEHFSPYPYPFPGPPYDWEESVGVYYSVERALTQIVPTPLGFIPDDGDVYEHFFGLYLDDSTFAPIVGFDEDIEQLDALIVYDVFGGKEIFDGGGDWLNSDAIFFSLAPGVFDPIGDDIYWYSAAWGGVGGLYGDPGLFENVDALDNHPIPEPCTMILLGSGLLGLAGFSRKKFNKS